MSGGVGACHQTLKPVATIHLKILQKSKKIFSQDHNNLSCLKSLNNHIIFQLFFFLETCWSFNQTIFLILLLKILNDIELHSHFVHFTFRMCICIHIKMKKKLFVSLPISYIDNHNSLVGGWLDSNHNSKFGKYPMMLICTSSLLDIWKKNIGVFSFYKERIKNIN